MQHECLLSPDKEPMTDWGMTTTKVQHSESMNFIEDTYRNVGEGLPIRAENDSQTKMHHQSPPRHGWQHCTGYSQLSRLDGVLSKWLSWYKPSPGSSAGLCFFQTASWSGLRVFAAWIIWEGCSELVLFTLRKKGFHESGQFQGLPEAFLSYLPSGWRKFPTGWNVFISEETFPQQIT